VSSALMATCLARRFNKQLSKAIVTDAARAPATMMAASSTRLPPVEASFSSPVLQADSTVTLLGQSIEGAQVRPLIPNLPHP